MALYYVEGAMIKYIRAFKTYLSITIFFIPISLPQTCYSKSAAELSVAARVLARDPSSSGRVRFTDAQILEFLNEGQRDTIGATLCIRKEYSFDTSSGTVYYSLPSDFMQLDRVLSDNKKLEEKSPAKLDQASTEWETETGEPVNFYINFSSRARIGFYPYPITSSSTESIKVEYYAQAVELTSSDTPFNSITEFTPFHSMLSFYAASEMGFIDGLISQADRYFQRYMIYRNGLNDYCRARPSYSPNINVAPNK